MVQANLEPGQYANWTELATGIGIGVGAAEYGQTRGYAWRNGYGAGIAGAAWVGWNIGTFIYLNGPAVDSWIRVNLGPAAWIGGMSSNQATRFITRFTAVWRLHHSTEVKPCAKPWV